MPADDERREVARRLRESRPCKSGYTEWWKIAQALGLKEPAGWFGWEKFEPDSANRLADLIEPDGKGIESEASKPVESDGISRDALLAFADEMSDYTWYETEGDHRIAEGFARRIREALGVER